MILLGSCADTEQILAPASPVITIGSSRAANFLAISQFRSDLATLQWIVESARAPAAPDHVGRDERNGQHQRTAEEIRSWDSRLQAPGAAARQARHLSDSVEAENDLGRAVEKRPAQPWSVAGVGIAVAPPVASPVRAGGRRRLGRVRRSSTAGRTTPSTFIQSLGCAISTGEAQIISRL